MSKNLILPSLLLNYQDYILNTRRLSSKTVKEYMLDLSLFYRFILVKKYANQKIEAENFIDLVKSANITDLSNNMITEITWDDLQSFLSYYAGLLNNNERSQKRKIVSIRKFYDYLLITKKIPANPIGVIDIKAPKKQPISLTEEEITENLQPVLESYEGPFKERDKAILILFLELGLRLNEVVCINLEDIEVDNILIKGKGKKERILPLNDICIQAIKEYLDVRPKAYEIKPGHQDALFISRQGKRLSSRTIQLIVDKFLDAANVNTNDKKYTPHKLRHTFATLLADKGVSVHDIQEFLGHEDLATTSVYVNSKYKRLREVKNNNPILKIK